MRLRRCAGSMWWCPVRARRYVPERRFARLLDETIESPERGTEPLTNDQIGEACGVAGTQARQWRSVGRPMTGYRLLQLPLAVTRPLCERILAAHPETVAEIEHEHTSDAIAQAIGSMGYAQAGLAAVILHSSARDPAAISREVLAAIRDLRRVQAHLEKQRPANDT